MKRHWKSVIATALAFVMFAGAALPALAAPKVVKITGNPVAVREGAGTSERFIRQVRSGEKYEYLSQKKAKNGTVWYQMKLSAEKQGWVVSSYAKVETLKSKGKIEVLAKLLNVRATPSMEGKILGTTRKGTQFAYYAVKQDADKQTWYQVETSEGQTAWLLGTYCEEVSGDAKKPDAKKSETQKTETQKPVSESKTVKGKQAEVIVRSANIRESASTGSRKLGNTGKGSRFTCLASATGADGKLWYQIQYTAKQKGWMLASLVILTEAKELKPAKNAKIVEITQTPVNIRASASEDGEKLGRAAKGKQYTYISERKDQDGRKWYRIQYTAKQKGWVQSRFCKVIAPAKSEAAADRLNNSYKVSIKTKTAAKGRIKVQYPQISGLYDAKMQETYNELFLKNMEAAVKDAGKGKLTVKAKTQRKTKDTLSILFEGVILRKGAAHASGYAYAVNIDLATGCTFVPSAQYGAAKAAEAILDGKWSLVKGNADVAKSDVKKHFQSYTQKKMKKAIAESGVFTVTRSGKGKYSTKGKTACRSYINSKGKTVFILDVPHALGDYVKAAV